MSSNQAIAIAVKNLSKRFTAYSYPYQRLLAIFFKRFARGNAFSALDNISLEIYRGETIGIIGQNGSGKSTLLQIMCGIMAPSEGQIEVKGRIAALLELGAGFNLEFTGKENVFLSAAVLGMSREEIELRYNAIVEFAEIGEYINLPVKTYSSGMFVRLAFAVAINVKPDILIIDEALSVGDVRFQAKCFNKIQQLKSANVTILFVSHDIGSIKQFCDRVVWLNQGAIVLIGEPLQVASEYMEFATLNQEFNKLQICSKGENNNKSQNAHTICASTMSTGVVNHWGRAKGSILSFQVLNEKAKPTTVFYDNERITICLQFKMPSTAQLEYFGAAFAIRAINGTDLAVYDTLGQGFKFDSLHQEFTLEFQFKNFLNEGQYLLVVALEERINSVVSYYEFIEGIEYFSVIREKAAYGLFIPEVTMANLTSNSEKQRSKTKKSIVSFEIAE